MLSRNPATGEVLRTFAPHDPAEVERRLAQSVAAQRQWRARPIAERAPALRALADRLRARQDALASVMTAEMGKPLAEARAEIEKSAWVCAFYAAEAEAMLAPRAVAAKVPENHVCYRPLGTLLGVMPWNFPFWQVYRFAAPALMAGNAVLIKHAPNTLGCMEEMEALAREAGLPEGLFAEVRVEVERVPDLIADPRVRAVTVTGSERAGSAVAAVAGAALKPSVLELGGSDPFIVLADADLEAALDVGVASRCLNAGQSCIAAKRFIVEAPVWDRFVAGLVDRMRALTVGDPTDPSVRIGPLARADLRDHLHAQVQASIDAGARLLTGGAPLPGPGFFYAPTVLAEPPPGCPAAADELFGPVGVVLRAQDAEDAVRIANDTRYGLSASLWTRDRARARGWAARIEAGAVFINQMSYSDPRLPFGGIGVSGYGRELGPEGIRAFVNIQTVSVG